MFRLSLAQMKQVRWVRFSTAELQAHPAARGPPAPWPMWKSQVAFGGGVGRLLASLAKAACSQLIAGIHLGRVSLATILTSLPYCIIQPLWQEQEHSISTIIFDLV